MILCCRVCKLMFRPKKEIIATEKYIHRDRSCRIINYFDNTGLKAYIICEYGIICHNCIPIYWHNIHKNDPRGDTRIKTMNRRSLRLMEKTKLE